MELVEKLDDLRSRYPECRTLAFADISTGMILCTSAEGKLRQEKLDSLCGTAVEMLSGSIAKHIGGAFPAQEDSGVYQAIIVEPAEIGIFLKSTINPADALCCVCLPAIKLGAFIEDARNNLAEFGADA